jgi:hypothetical protein
VAASFFVRACDKDAVDNISARHFVNQVEDVEAFSNSLCTSNSQARRAPRSFARQAAQCSKRR